MSGLMQFFKEQSKSVRKALFVVAFLSGVAFGQNESGQINGRVSDPSGAVITGAIVQAKSVETGLERLATTSDEGFYVITSLPPGIYEVTVQATGFATRAQRVRVFVGSSVRFDIGLTVTPVTVEERVFESASGGEINTQSGQLSDPITVRQLRELPVVTRDPYSLVTLSGNVTPFRVHPLGAVPLSGISPVVINTQPDQDFSINGQNPNFNNVLIDGGENIVNYWSTLGQRIPLDGVQGINVITNGFRPEYGRLGGGLINVGTRSGSNDWRGSVFYFYRGDALNSNDFEGNAFGRERGHLVGNQPGFAVGGPIVRDKFFFFNSTEGLIVRSREDRVTLVPTFGTVATPGLLALSAPATQAFFTAPAGFPPPTTNVLRTLSVGDTLALLGIAVGGSTPLGSFSGLPLATPAFNAVATNVNTDIGGGLPQDSLFSVTRLDYTLSDRSLVYGRYAYSTRDIYRGALSFSPFFGFNTGVNEQAHNGMINWLQTLSGPNCCSGPGASAWLMNLKAQFSRINLRRSNDVNTVGQPRLASTGFAGANLAGFPLAFPGDFPFDPNLNSLLTGPLNLFQFGADFAGSWRSHQVQFGWNYFYFQDNRNILSFQDGLFTLGSNIPSALDNLVNGTASSFSVAINPIATPTTTPPTTTPAIITPIGALLPLPVSSPNFNRSISEHDFSAYGSINWRVSSRANLLLGVRYDIFGRPRSRNDQIFFNFFPGAGTTPAAQVANGRLLPTGFDLDGSGFDLDGDGDIDSFDLSGDRDNSFFHRDFNNVAPRIGFAWDITGGAGTCCSGPDRRTTLRAGFGITYERLFYATSPFFQTRSDFAIASLTSVPATGTPSFGTIPLSTSNFGPLGGTTGTVAFPGQLVRAIDRDINSPKVWFWDVALEREIFRNTVMALQYAGSAGRDLFTFSNVNRPGSAVFLTPTVPPPTARLNTGLNPIFFLDDNGRSNYNAFIADFTNNTWRTNGWQFTARYRFAKALDNVSTFFGNNFGVFGGSFTPDFLSPFDPDNDYGLSDFDVRHRFIGSVTWEVPYDWFGSGGCCGGTSWWARLLSGWSLTGIVAAQTGFPLNVFDCSGALTPETPCPRALVASGVDLGSVRDGQGSDFPNSIVPNRFNFISNTNFTPATPGFVFPPFPTNTIGRNFFRGPGFWNVDFGVYKRIRITENTNFQLRGEFFNVFNHANLFAPSGTDISSVPFVPAFKFGRRIIQVGAKFNF